MFPMFDDQHCLVVCVYLRFICLYCTFKCTNQTKTNRPCLSPSFFILIFFQCNLGFFSLSNFYRFILSHCEQISNCGSVLNETMKWHWSLMWYLHNIFLHASVLLLLFQKCFSDCYFFFFFLFLLNAVNVLHAFWSSTPISSL